MSPVPVPSENETRDNFMKRCIGFLAREGGRSNDQIVAICSSQWSEGKKKQEETHQEEKRKAEIIETTTPIVQQATDTLQHEIEDVRKMVSEIEIPETDLKPIYEELDILKKKIDDKEIPVTDIKPIIKGVNDLKELIKKKDFRGRDGITPKKGKDYFTDGEKKEWIESLVKEIKRTERNIEEIITGKYIKNKLEELKGKDRLSAKAIKDLKPTVLQYGAGGGVSELSELDDVGITSPTNNQALRYNTTTGKWENTNVEGGDITSVIAGDGLSGGGSIGDVTLANSDKGSSAVSSHEGLYSHDLIATALQSETDPVFTAWDKDYNDLINRPSIPEAYVLPTATDLILGGIKVGARLSIADGVLSADVQDTYTDEKVDDRVSSLIQNGTGIAWTYDDVANTLTGNVSITQYTDELAQDAVGGMLLDTNSINLTYTDGTPALSADLNIQDTTSVDLAIDASGLKATVLPAGVHHGDLAGLTDDDHTQYFLADGTRNMTGAIKVVTNLDKFALYENDVAEADAFLKLTNSTTTANILAPRLWLKSNKVGAGTGSQLLFDVSSDEVTDTGQVADISMRLNNAGAITNRPLLTFSNWTTNIVTLLANGNVGISTSDPQNDLHIVTDGSQYAGITITSTASGETTGFLKVCDMYPDGQFTPGLSGKSSSTTYAGFRVRGLADTGGIATEIQATNYTENGAIGATDTLLRIRNYTTGLVTVLGNGNFGIGTSEPAQALHVVGAIKVVSNANKFALYENDVAETDAFFVLGNATTTSGKFAPYLTMKGNPTGAAYTTAIVAECNSDEVTDTGAVFQLSSRASGNTVTNRPLFDLTNYATYVMRVTAGGFVGIGTTSPATLLDVTGTTGGRLSLSRNDTSVTANDTLGLIDFRSNDTSTTSNQIAARIIVSAANTITTNINPGIMSLQTTGTAVGGTLIECMSMRATTVPLIGFFGATPVVQQAYTAVSNPPTQAQVTAIRTALINLGLMAAS